MSRTLQFDIAIVGGGMVGAALALALQDAGFHAVLIEKTRPQAFDIEEDYDLRLSAISPASCALLKHLDVWSAIAAARTSPYQHMRVLDAAGQGQLDFSGSELGISELGHIIENRLILHALWQAMDGYVQLRCPAEPVSVQQQDEQVVMELDNGQTIASKLLIAADGPGSQIREWAGIPVGGWGYEQQGIVCNVRTDRSESSTAWQRFLPSGPLAFLPLGCEQGDPGVNQYSIVWSADKLLAEELMALDDEAFMARLNEASDTALGAVTDTSPRAAFPLRMQHADAYCQDRVVLIGDAAHVIHPLAGQGVNLGFLDVATLVDVLSTAKEAGRDWSLPHVLARYQRMRKADNALMMAATDGLKRLHGNANPLLGALRNLGMDAVNQLTPLKNLLTLHALGMSPDLPPLVRPPKSTAA